MGNFNRTLNISAQVQRTIYSEWNHLQVSTHLVYRHFQKLLAETCFRIHRITGLKLLYLWEKPLHIIALSKTLLNSKQYFTTQKKSFSIWKGCFNILNKFTHFGANYDQSFLEIVINISYFLYLGQRYFNSEVSIKQNSLW